MILPKNTTAVVHHDPPDAPDQLLTYVGAQPGWYVVRRRSCIVITGLPFATEAEAQATAGVIRKRVR